MKEDHRQALTLGKPGPNPTLPGIVCDHCGNPCAQADNEIIQSVEMLSFFAALPPPDFTPMDSPLARNRVGYQRQLARSLDMTALSEGPRVILIGHMQNASLPAPLSLNGQTVPSSGWTVVRMIVEVN